jgi:hypothetical protein
VGLIGLVIFWRVQVWNNSVVMVSERNDRTGEQLIREKLRSLFRAIKFDFMASPILQYLDSEGGRLLPRIIFSYGSTTSGFRDH